MTTVFFDVDTQIDFLYPAGALYVPGAEAIVDNIARLNRYAAASQSVVVSTMDAHIEDDPEFEQWPPHCVAGIAGQNKPASTLLEKRAVIPVEAGPLPALDGVQQINVEKRTFSCFLNPNLPALLKRLRADRYVVYGVVTEICVAHAARGLLKTGARVELVTDAVKSLNDQDRQQFLNEFIAAGGHVTTLATLISE